MEMERLFASGATVSLFSLVIEGSEEEEENMEAGEPSFAEPGGQARTMSRKRARSHGGFLLLQINPARDCFILGCFASL